jgi:glycosyltransferase involved in cell wall biosynthesis
MNPPTILPVPEDGKPRPFWSAMIPAYNPPKDYLEQTLRSVLAQDPGPEQMQIEVVDDCSPKVDVTALVREIAGDRVIVSQTPKNLGLAGCWNTCIERSLGEWVHIFHQDDVVLPGFYAALRQGIESDSQVGLAFCRHIFLDSDGHWLGLSAIEQPVAGRFPEANIRLTEMQRIQTPAVVVRREAYEQLGGFRTDLSFALDWEMWCRIANRHAVWFEPRVLAAYRSHPASASSRLARNGEDVRDTLRCIAITEKMLPAESAHRVGCTARTNYALLLLDNAWNLAGRRQYADVWTQAQRACSCSGSRRVIWKLWLLVWQFLGLELRRLFGRSKNP